MDILKQFSYSISLMSNCTSSCILFETFIFSVKRNKEKISSDDNGLWKIWRLQSLKSVLLAQFRNSVSQLPFQSRNIIILKLIFCKNAGKISIKRFFPKTLSLTRAKNLWQTIFIAASLYMALWLNCEVHASGLHYTRISRNLVVLSVT